MLNALEIRNFTIIACYSFCLCNFIVAEYTVAIIIKFIGNIVAESFIREVRCIDCDARQQGKRNEVFVVSAIVFVGDRIGINRQSISLYGAASPVCCFARFKSKFAQFIKIKGSARQCDRIGVVVRAQSGQSRVFAEIHRGQIVVGAFQILQCCILAEIQRGQFIIVAVQHLQRCIVAEIQHCQIVAAAYQFHQIFIFADIQSGQVVFAAVQIRQSFIFADIQSGQVVFAAVQILQRRKMRNAGQILNAVAVDIDLFDLRNFRLVECVIVVGIKFGNILAENSVREIFIINGNSVAITAAALHSQGKRNEVFVVSAIVFVGDPYCIGIHRQSISLYGAASPVCCFAHVKSKAFQLSKIKFSVRQCDLIGVVVRK